MEKILHPNSIINMVNNFSLSVFAETFPKPMLVSEVIVK